jgi:hypothetical protein
MDRETLESQVLQEQSGTCEFERLSIHVSGRKAGDPPPDKRLCSL